MADRRGKPPVPDPKAEALDWITIWQSELTALATDRELHDSWTRLVGLWADTAERITRLLPGPLDGSAGRPGPAAAPGTTPPVAAPDPRDAALQQLAERVAELERKLAERDAGPAGHNPGP